MPRTAGSKNTKPKTVDPLLAALFARVPPPETIWPVAARAAWLEMVERAFDVLYGAAQREVKVSADIEAAFYRNGGQRPVNGTPPEEHSFYIDKEGFARIAGGERINASMVDGILFDQRGEGDLGAIVWADGSKGVLGKVLDIRPA